MKESTYVDETIGRAPAFLFRRVSWGAIFAGLFVTMVIQLTLTVLGVAIGATVFNPGQDSSQALATGSAVWIVVTALISLFVGACVAGRLSGGPRRVDGMIHGIVTWSVSTLVMLFLVTTSVGAVLGGLGSLLGNGLQNRRGETEISRSGISQGLNELLPNAGNLAPTGRNQNENAGTPGQLTSLAAKDPQLGAALAKLEVQDGGAQSGQQRQDVINILMSKHGMDQQQASAALDQWNQEFHQKSQLAGQAIASGASKAGWWGFVALILGLIVAAWGGWTGTASIPGRLETTATAPVI